MSHTVRTRPIDWLICIAVTLVGGLFLLVAVRSSQPFDASSGPERNGTAPFVVAGSLLAIGLWGLRSCYRNRHAEPLSHAQIKQSFLDPKRVRLATILCSLAMYGAVLSAMLHEDSLPTSIAVFGERPLGLPLRLFLVLYFTVLSIPVPVGVWHLYRILFRAASEGAGFSKQDILRSLLQTPSVHVDLRRSRRIVLGVAAFYVSLMVGWIAYASARGI